MVNVGKYTRQPWILWEMGWKKITPPSHQLFGKKHSRSCSWWRNFMMQNFKKANVPMIIFKISTGTRGHFSVVLGGFQVSILFIWNDFDPQEIEENYPNLTCAYGLLNVWLNHQLRYWMDRWAMKKHGLVALYWCMYLQLYSLHTTSGECTAGESGTKAEL